MIKVMARPSEGRYLYSFLKFDLLAGCEGGDEPTHLPGGKTELTAELELTLLREDRPVSAGSNRVFQLTLLPEGGFPWHEDHTNWDQVNLCGVVPQFGFPCPGDSPDQDMFKRFPVAGGKGSKVNVDVTYAVNQWYSGDLPNRGWALDRNFIVDEGIEEDWNWKPGEPDYGGWWFGSQENTDSSVHPKLILTWE